MAVVTVNVLSIVVADFPSTLLLLSKHVNMSCQVHPREKERCTSLEMLYTSDASNSPETIKRAASKVLLQTTHNLDWLVFHRWYKIIETDQIECFSEVLSLCNEKETQLLLTGNFTYQSHGRGHSRRFGSSRNRKDSEKCNIQKPFILAASFCSTKIFRKMISIITEKDLISLDYGDINGVHAFIIALNEEQQLHMSSQVSNFIDLYHTLMRSISLQGRHALLMQTDKKGFRPLELAAHFGQTDMFMTIFREEGIYRFSQEKHGMMTRVLYDVTDYEAWAKTGSRVLMSPLRQIFTNQTNFKYQVKSDLTKEPVMTFWMQSKFYMNIPLIFIKFLFRTSIWLSLMLTSPGLGDQGAANFTGGGEVEACTTIVTGIPVDQLVWFNCSMCMVGMLWDLGLIGWRIYLMSCRKSHSFASLMRPDMNYEFLFHKMVFWTIAVYSLSVPILKESESFVATGTVPLIHSIVSATSIFSLTYTLQTIPGIGIYVICIIEMVIVMASFLPLFVLCLVSFTFYFAMITLTVHFCSNYFSNAILAIYSTFRIMLNLLDPYTFETSTPNPVYFLHILFILFVPILLLNFLIGLMSNAVNYVMSTGPLRVLESRTEVAIASEYDTSVILRWLFEWRASFFFLVKNGKLYIECFEVEGSARNKES